MASYRLHSAWVEINAGALRENLKRLALDRPPGVDWIFVVKDDAYGHGLLLAAHLALESGIGGFAVSNLDEGVALRDAGISQSILILGEPLARDLQYYHDYDLTISTGTLEIVRAASRIASRSTRQFPLALEIDTGMSRYGVRWQECVGVIEGIRENPGVRLESVFSHFAMSDEADKSFAHLQLKRFKHCLTDLRRSGCVRAIPHMCNSGGYLDLPEAHFSMVRLGILPWGVYPSLVCRRIPGLRSVMSVRSRIVSCRAIQQGDNIGYGLNYQAPAPMMVATVPVGYGDGFPRVRNCGCVLLRGQRAPILGRVSMDAIVIDVSSLLGVHPEEEVTLMGTQGSNSIDAKELANLKGTTPYDILAGWRHRLPRTVLALDADIASNEITESHLGNLEGR